MKALLLSAALLLAASTFSFAEENCGDKTNQTDMNICSGQQYSQADDELNKVYKEIEGRLKDHADTKKLLVAAQRGWVGFRDAECAFSSSTVLGGTAYPFVSNTCLAEMTKTRTNELKGYLQCTEGELDCPVPAAN